MNEFSMNKAAMTHYILFFVSESNLHMQIKELPPLQVRDLFDPSKLPNEEIGQKILNLATETTANSSGAIYIQHI